MQKGNNSYLVFKDYQLIFMFKNTNAQYLLLNPKIKDSLDGIKSFIEISRNYISNHIV